MIKIINQNEECGYVNYMQRMDDMFSNWGRFSGMLANVLTDIIVYYATSNSYTPAVIKSYTDYIIPAFNPGWNNADWTKAGEGWMLFLSSLVKFEMQEEDNGTEPVDG